MRVRRALFFASMIACDRHPAPSAIPTPAASAPAEAPASPSPCGDMTCRPYDSARDAFLAAIAGDPLVIAVGEAHAQQGATAASAVKRFSDEILPALVGRASDVLLEAMMPPTGCASATQAARQAQETVTKRESANNRNEYLALGEHAHALGIFPDLLRPTCQDMDAVRDAGEQGIDVSLRLIARLCEMQAERLVDRDAHSDADRGKAVIVYSGMLHNDLTPPPDQAAYAYAPALASHVGGRLTSIDLVVPEFITDDDTWKSLPWVSRYDRARMGRKPTLITTGEHSYVLVFAESAP